MTAIQTEVFDDADQLATDVANRFVEICQKSISRDGRCVIALAGGSTPKRLYQLLASDRFCDQVDWSRLHLFLSDERCVPLDHPDSNYRMAREALLDHVAAPDEQVYAVPTHLDASEAARSYEFSIRSLLAPANDEIPAFDLVLLGIGGDGHTASLFPGTKALEVAHRLVVENWVPQQESMRITFTIPLLQAARQTILMATGDDKAEAVHRAVVGPLNVQETPSQILRDSRGTVTFALDRSAGARLSA